jgi:hypothetical protein
MDRIDKEKAGMLPPFLTRAELDDALAAWHRIWNNPTISPVPKPPGTPRFIVDNQVYREAAFARIATHPVVQEAARRVLGPEIMLIDYAVVATPPYAIEPSVFGKIPFHIDHVVFSDVPVEDARDTMVCIWINFEELALENGPFCIAPGTDKWNIDWGFFKKRPGLTITDLGIQPLAQFATGPAGTTAVYSGKTWHSATNNCSKVVRKGINLNFLRKPPIDCHKRLPNDITFLPADEHAALEKLIGIPGYIEPRQDQNEHRAA